MSKELLKNIKNTQAGNVVEEQGMILQFIWE